MVTVFANNQTIAGESGNASVITTDPVPMRGNDRVSAVANVHYMFGGTGQSLSLILEASNDGTNWITVKAYTAITTTGVEPLGSEDAPYAFVRLKMSFTPTAGDGAVGFDVHAVLDHS